MADHVVCDNQLQLECYGACLALQPSAKPKQPNGPYQFPRTHQLPRAIQEPPKAPSHVPAIAGAPVHPRVKELPVQPVREQHQHAMIEGEHIWVNAPLLQQQQQQQQLQQHNIACNQLNDQEKQSTHLSSVENKSIKRIMAESTDATESRMAEREIGGIPCLPTV